ncbi:MAG: helix-turn-helix domain-containing protein [Hyphomicrobiales bacterium]
MSRALKLIDQGALDEGSVNELAERLGVGSRHLSRLFAKHVGASPLQTARTVRLQRAKCLLDETNLKIADIAFKTGFGSIRQFNATFAERYSCSPSQYRKKIQTSVRQSIIQK